MFYSLISADTRTAAQTHEPANRNNNTADQTDDTIENGNGTTKRQRPKGAQSQRPGQKKRAASSQLEPSSRPAKSRGRGRPRKNDISEPGAGQSALPAYERAATERPQANSDRNVTETAEEDDLAEYRQVLTRKTPPRVPMMR